VYLILEHADRETLTLVARVEWNHGGEGQSAEAFPEQLESAARGRTRLGGAVGADENVDDARTAGAASENAAPGELVRMATGVDGKHDGERAEDRAEHEPREGVVAAASHDQSERDADGSASATMVSPG
jgi:hypothetical protein